MIPLGWMLVPIEPTEGMRQAGFKAAGDVRFNSGRTHPVDGWDGYAVRCYRAMVDAAPQPLDEGTNKMEPIEDEL